MKEIYYERTIWQMVRDAGKKYPTNMAYRFMGIPTSFEAFLPKVEKASRAFYAYGVRKGSYVLFCMPNLPQIVDDVYAVNKIGGVSCIIHPLSSPAEIAYFLKDTQADVVVCLDSFCPSVKEGIAQSGLHPKVIVTDIADALPEPAREGFRKQNAAPPIPDGNILYRDFLKAEEDFEEAVDPDAAAVLFYSGGTTGKPKGTLLSSRNLNSMPIQTDDCYLGKKKIKAFTMTNMNGLTSLAVIPFFHGFGFCNGVHLMLSYGGASILVPKFEPKEFGRLVATEKPNVISGVPGFYYALMMTPELQNADLSFIKGAFGGGDAFPTELVDNFNAFLASHGSETTLQGAYGLTETATMVCIMPLTENKKGSTGLTMPDVKIKICVPNTDEEVPIGEKGEICVCGPNVMKGYLNNEKETAMALHTVGGEKWLHTGDCGYVDEDGYLFFVQRIKRIIISAGYNIYPTELESVLARHDKIKESCCVGIPDVCNGQNVKAYIVLREGAEKSDGLKKEILEYCSGHIATYALPAEIEFIDALPRTKVGKIAFAELEKRTKKEEKPKDFSDKKVALEYALEETLGLKEFVSAEEFFRAGGSSLQVFRLLLRLRAMGWNLSMSTLASARSEEDILAKMTPYNEETDGYILARDKEYPLTSMQNSILVPTLLAGGKSCDCNNVSVMRIDERWDDECFFGAFRLLAARYDILLTSFLMSEGKNRQKILHDRTIPCKVLTADSVDDLVKMESEYTFDLEKDCLFRVYLVHGKDCDRLVENVHHALIDGWSYYLMNKTMIAYYRRLRSGEPFDKLSRQAADDNASSLSFASYVRYLMAKDTKKAESYWQDLLENYENGELKPPKTVIEKKENIMKTVHYSMDGETNDRLRAFAKERGISIVMFSKVVWAILLQKYTFCEDVVFGEVVAGRNENLKGMEEAIGYFLNTLPVRLDVNAQKKITELFEEVRTQQMKSHENACLALPDIMTATKCPALIGTLFNFLEQDDTYYGTHDVFDMESIVNYSGYDLEWEINGGVHYSFNLRYNGALYEEEDAKRLVGRILQCMDEIIKNPDRTVGEICVLPEEEREILASFNDTTNVYDETETVVKRFEKQARLTPDAVALEFYDTRFTYRRLDEQSDGLAKKLISIGVKKGDVVAVFAHRNCDTIATLFGILKCGAAYLPLDETYPKERLDFVLCDSGAKAVVVGDGLTIETDLPTVSPVQPFCGKCDREVGADDMAYIIYTSGTTGKPKGVVTVHRGLSNLLLSYENIYRLRPSDIVLQVASYTFDQSVWDIFGILCIGGRLVLIGEDDVHDPELIAKYANEKNVTIASFTPAMVAELDPHAFRTLRILDTSGETAHPAVLKKWVGKADVVNTYGPTEYTVNSCSYYYIGKEWEKIPIGSPIYNTRFFVLGKGDSLVGIGMQGELCIGGDGISAGYLNRKELTEEKFIPAIDGKGKMYRSGDLVSWRKDGVIDFYDRIDGQIKIRGFRIELGEIDSVLRSFPDVADCYVGVFDFTGTKAIAAYIVGERDLMEIKTELRKKLPEYMVPQYLVRVGRIPRTLAGKVDKKSLPVPERVGKKAETDVRQTGEKSSAPKTFFEAMFGKK